MKEKFDDKEIDSLFHEKLGQEEIAPREIVWTKISQELGGTGGKRPVTWIWWLSGIILLLSVGTWFGISYSGKNKIAANKTGWNYNNPSNSDFDSVPYDNDGRQNDVVKTESGTFSKEKAGSPGQQSNTGNKENIAAMNPGKEQAANGNPEKKIKSAENISSPGKNNPRSVPPTENNPALASGNKPVNDNLNPPVIVPDFQAPEPADSSSDSPGNDSALANKAPVTYFDTAQRIIAEPPPVYHVVNPDSTNPVVKSDSTQTKADSTKTTAGPAPEIIFPDFFISMHGGLDAGKIMKVEYTSEDDKPTDVNIYDPEKIKSTPQQTFSYGIRFGKFIRKRLSLSLGAYYSIFETSGNEGNLKFNHNSELVFNMNTPTSSVHCASSNFDYHDSNLLSNDTFYIALQSREKYDYFNLQLGVSLYALRKKHVGIYGALYSNESFLLKKQMVITVPKTGKEISWWGEKLTGMNPFVWNGQAALGMEWLPFGNFGLWVEPSYYFSARLNTANSVKIHPGGMKYLVGMTWHF